MEHEQWIQSHHDLGKINLLAIWEPVCLSPNQNKVWTEFKCKELCRLNLELIVTNYNHIIVDEQHFGITGANLLQHKEHQQGCIISQIFQNNSTSIPFLIIAIYGVTNPWSNSIYKTTGRSHKHVNDKLSLDFMEDIEILLHRYPKAPGTVMEDFQEMLTTVPLNNIVMKGVPIRECRMLQYLLLMEFACSYWQQHPDTVAITRWNAACTTGHFIDLYMHNEEAVKLLVEAGIHKCMALEFGHLITCLSTPIMTSTYWLCPSAANNALPVWHNFGHQNGATTQNHGGTTWKCNQPTRSLQPSLQ